MNNTPPPMPHPPSTIGTRPSAIGRPLPLALFAAFSLPLYFVLIYFGSAYLTASRQDVCSLAFPFESRIPLIPIFIIPYLALDFLCIIALFLCTTRHELLTLLLRLMLAITLAGACFVLLPLRFAFPRPTPTGSFSILYQILRAIDNTHNMLPSLHAAITLILWPTLTRHTPKPLQIPLHLWLALALLSALFTHQHHLPDLLAALVLAALSFLLPLGRHPERSDQSLPSSPLSEE